MKYLLILALVFISTVQSVAADNSDSLGVSQDSILRFYNDLNLEPKNRLEINSGQFCTSNPSDHKFIWTYSGWDQNTQERVRHTDIEKEFLNIINNSKDIIVASFFLFDNLYSKKTPQSTIADKITEALIAKKKENPNISIVLILDPINRSYSRRVPPKVKLLLDHGVDVYFSDLLSTKPVNKFAIITLFKRLKSTTSGLTGGLLNSLTGKIGSKVNLCVPFTDSCVAELDGHKADLEVLSNAVLLKANHRKIIVADNKTDNEWTAIVSSANPHNASNHSTNTAIVTKGDIAKYIYSNLREDVGYSVLLESSNFFRISENEFSRKYAWLSKETKEKYPRMFRRSGYKNSKRYFNEYLPPIDLSSLKRNPNDQYCQTYVSEKAIKDEIIKQLNKSEYDDEIRIIMFYLSDQDVVDALIRAANRPGRTKKIKLLLDPSKDAFNSIKDGTPNRQVAHYIQSRTKNLKIRWYATHGEQNHAKAMIINNHRTKKYSLFTGSANWTGKNINNSNMESNLLLEGHKSETLKANALFDELWYNKKADTLYSWNYFAYDIERTALIVEGYKVVKEMNAEEKSKWISTHQQYLDEFYNYYSKLSDQNQKNIIKSYYNPSSSNRSKSWLKTTQTKNESAMLMAMSLHFGQDIYENKSDQEANLWLNECIKSYMKKWKKGESTGLVSW